MTTLIIILSILFLAFHYDTKAKRTRAFLEKQQTEHQARIAEMDAFDRWLEKRNGEDINNG